MKKVFIYYSFTGSGDLVATHLEEKGYELRRIIRKRKLPQSFFFSIMAGGFLASIKHKDKLLGLNTDIKEFDEVVIGSPIWNGRICSPINTVLSKINFEGKKLTFLFYAGSGEGKKALKRVNKEYPDAKVVFLKEPKKHLDELNKLKNF